VTTSGDTIVACRICGDVLGEPFVAREMMFGFRDEFEYLSCPRCKAVQLRTVPGNMSRYYPDTYYAFTTGRRSGLRMQMRRLRHRLTLGTGGPLAWLAQRLKPHPAVAWIKRTRMTRDSRVLDVGSGSGFLLMDLHEAGFRSLTGVDPYLSTTASPAPGIRMVKGDVHDLEPAFDVVMFHHSLEHMTDQHGALAGAARLMADDGWCIVRVPIVSSYAWETYREHWVQLDPPRHIVLHSVESIKQLAAASGLRLVATEYDSSEFQFLGSELYRRDRPLSEIGEAFTRKERRAYRRQAARLNAEGRGDQAVFYFQKGAR
jgi:SAM-dependent methyltransferase